MATFGGLFFEYPYLFLILVLGISAIVAWRYANYLWTPGWSGSLRRWVGVYFAAYLVSVITLAPLAWLTYRYVGLPYAFARGEIGILVAEVPDQENREQQTAYENALRLEIKSSNSEQLRRLVKVRLIERPLPPDDDAQQAEALKIGHWLRASFVLRPFVVEHTQEPWLTVVSPASELSLGKFQNDQLANLDQLILPDEVTLFAETMLALVLAQRQSYDKAAQVLGDLLKSPKLPESASSRSAMHFLRGNYLLLSGNANQGIVEFKEALRLNSDLAVAHLNLGIALTQKGNYDAAIAEDQKAIRLKPNLVEAHLNLANTFGKMDQYDASITESKEALRLKPELAVAHSALCAALDEKGQYEAAIAECREAIRLDPHLAEAHFNLGTSLDHEGQHDARIVEYQQAIRLKPNWALAHYKLGGALYKKGQYDAAITECREALGLKPDPAVAAMAHSDLGTALAGKGQYGAAIAEYRDTISLVPYSAMAHSTLCNILIHKGQYFAAIAECREAIRLNPNFATAHHYLGIALLRTGQDAQASREFKAADDLDQSTPPPPN